MDRWIHFNMAIVGGFLGGFAILNHHELFGSAQTSNLISVFADLAGHPDANFFVRLPLSVVFCNGNSVVFL